MGKPTSIDHYDRYESNGIGVYVKPNIPTREGKLTIFTTQLLFIKALMVDGVATK